MSDKTVIYDMACNCLMGRARLVARAAESDNSTAAYVGQLEHQLRTRNSVDAAALSASRPSPSAY